MRECMALLRRFAGPTVEVPEALAMRRSQWFTNPYVRGSYSCRMVDSNTMDVWPRHLAQPVYNSWGKPVSEIGGIGGNTNCVQVSLLFFLKVNPPPCENLKRQSSRPLMAPNSSARHCAVLFINLQLVGNVVGP